MHDLKVSRLRGLFRAGANLVLLKPRCDVTLLDEQAG
jgi:hypothetical protein